MTYISQEIHFQLSGINYPHKLLKKLNSLFDQVDESHVMQLEKELISLDSHSFYRMEEYLVHLK